jgi:putative ABC transport system substrate-binding protein
MGQSGRRRFLIGASAVLSMPRIVVAQTATRLKRVGWLGDTFEGAIAPVVKTFQNGLRDAGYEVDRNVVIEFRSPEGHAERLPQLAADLVRLNVDAVLAVGAPSARVARDAMKGIPIVFMLVDDAMEAGLVTSLARPTGNITGVTTMMRDLTAKFLQLMKEAMPQLKRVGLLWQNTSSTPMARDLRVQKLVQKWNAEAKVQALEIRSWEIANVRDIDAALAEMQRQSIDAAVLMPDTLLFKHRARIAETALRFRLPTFTMVEAPVAEGCLMGYMPSYPEMFRRAGVMTGMVLKGVKPADIPVEQPRSFVLVINLKTAKALSIKIPQSILLRADKVIE